MRACNDTARLLLRSQQARKVVLANSIFEFGVYECTKVYFLSHST